MLKTGTIRHAGNKPKSAHNGLDYRQILRAELDRRIAANPSYSMRAFSRDIQLPAQQLSLVLNGKKGISLDVAVRIAERLHLDQHEALHFTDLVQFSLVKSEQGRRLLLSRINDSTSDSGYKAMSEDVFRSIADWCHIALMELTNLEDFKNNDRWIARRLGITLPEATAAKERLQRLGLLEPDSTGGLKKTDAKLSTTHDIPNEALRRYTAELIDRAKAALDAQSVDERDMTTLTLAIPTSKIPEAKKMIRAFRRRFCSAMDQGKCDEVYSLAISFFRTTQKSTGGSHE